MLRRSFNIGTVGRIEQTSCTIHSTALAMVLRDLFSRSGDSNDLDKLVQKADASYKTKVVKQPKEEAPTQGQV